MAKRKSPKKSLRTPLLVILGVAIVGLALLIVYGKGLMGGLDIIDKLKGNATDKNSKTQLSMHINSYIDFETSKTYGAADIQNKTENVYDVVVEIVLEDSKEVVYKSARLSPGEKIEKIKLDKALEKGNYTAIAYFNAYEKDNFAGKSGIKIKLNVLG